MITGVFFDFGGVILTSPFDEFAKYEEQNGLPKDLIRTINSTNPNGNAWAKFERNEVGPDAFASLFEAEAQALGHEVSGHAILGMLEGDVRPEMVEAVRRIKASGLTVACLTNNGPTKSGRGTGIASEPTTERGRQIAEVMSIFDEVVESSVVGIRKPEVGFYEIALERTGLQADQVVFLDDLGINLKPARGMGMTTIKVTSAAQALGDLQAILGDRVVLVP